VCGIRLWVHASTVGCASLERNTAISVAEGVFSIGGDGSRAVGPVF
jgi:hypothetical protein